MTSTAGTNASGRDPVRTILAVKWEMGNKRDKGRKTSE